MEAWGRGSVAESLPDMLEALGSLPSTKRRENLLFPFICFLSAKNSKPLPHAPTTERMRPNNQGQNLLKPGAKRNLS